MLSYHPALDFNHAMYRALRLVEASPKQSLSVDALRVVDFYFLFPHLMADLRLPRSLTAKKKTLARGASRYNRVPYPKHLFDQLGSVHNIALQALATKGLVDHVDLQDGRVTRTADPVPNEILQAFSKEPKAESELVEFLAGGLAQEPLLGDQGLKARSGLLEHRYDAA